jgi:hypothetical protein
MAGPMQRGSRGPGRSPRRGSSAAREAGFAAAPGSAATADSRASATTAATADRAPTGDPLVTRSTYRMLLMRGLAPAEAADLTAFMCGIPVGEVHWSLDQVNRLLFLRELTRTGRFGAQDGERPRPH